MKLTLLATMLAMTTPAPILNSIPPIDPKPGSDARELYHCRLKAVHAADNDVRLDRIAHIQMTSETFPQRINFPALEAVQQALASVPRVWQVEVWLETTVEEAQEQTRQPKACFEEAKGGVLFRVDVEDLPWMARLLAGLGVPFIIRRPRELCEVVHQYARTLVNYAERSEIVRA